MIHIIPLKKITSPIRSEKKLKSGVKVCFTYFNNFEEHIISKLNPCDDDEKDMYEKAKKLCYEIDKIIEIDYDNITDKIRNYIEKKFRKVQKNISYTSHPVPIPPYILGIWLGDGNSKTIALTNIDKVIINEWHKYAEDNNLYIRESDKKERKTIVNDYETQFVCCYYITSTNDPKIKNTILDEFKNLDLINNKHIPEIYLKNDESTRLELLAGLIDTDGTLAKQSYEITQKNEKLSNNIVELCKSLGFDTKISRCNKKCTNSKNKNHNGVYYRINISINQITPIIPLRCERKKQKEIYRHIHNSRRNKEPIHWTNELDKELYITVKSFQEIEPNQRIPWTMLEKFNPNLPINKSEAFRTRYDKYIKKQKEFNNITDRLDFNPIEQSWMDNYNAIYDIWNNHNNEGYSEKLLSEQLSNWFQQQKKYSIESNFYKCKRELLNKLIDIKPTSHRSQILNTLENIKNSIISGNYDGNIILLDNNKLYIPVNSIYENIKIGQQINGIKDILHHNDEEINYDIFKTKTELVETFNYILDDYHLDKAECRKDTIIQYDINNNIIKEYLSCKDAAETLKKDNEIKSVDNGRRLISNACKNNNICYNYYWRYWLEVHKNNNY